LIVPAKKKASKIVALTGRGPTKKPISPKKKRAKKTHKAFTPNGSLLLPARDTAGLFEEFGRRPVRDIRRKKAKKTGLRRSAGTSGRGGGSK
jgi:hypothetical protein